MADIEKIFGAHESISKPLEIDVNEQSCEVVFAAFD